MKQRTPKNRHPLLALLALAWLSSCATTPPVRVPAEAEAGARSAFSGRAWVVLSTKEVASRYDTFWAMSDVHGRGAKLAKLLHQAKLIDRPALGAKWTRSRQLLVIAGDFLDGGDEGIELVEWLGSLSNEARARDSRIILLMGNHEAELIADPRPDHLHDETRRSFAHALRTDERKLTESAIRGSAAWKRIRSMPLGAVIGPWLIGHSGLLDTSSDGLAEFTADLGALWESDGRAESDAFQKLSDQHGRSGSFLSRHDWWKPDNDHEEALLGSLGLKGLIAGHEPRLFPSKNVHQVALSHGGWAVGLDAGLKVDGDDPRFGEMLECSTRRMEASGELGDCRRLTLQGARPL